MNLHISNQYVLAGRYICLPCFQECGPPSHFHCPVCALTFTDPTKSRKLETHVATHDICKPHIEEFRRARAALEEKEKAKSDGGGTENGAHGGGRSTRGKRAAVPRPAPPQKQPRSSQVQSEPTTAPSKPGTRSAQAKADQPSKPEPKSPQLAKPEPKAMLKGSDVAGLYVNFDRTETSIVVDKLQEADPGSLLKYFRQLVMLENGKYVCKLCPPPDDPSAAVLQPHDTEESARDHFLKCHFR